MTCILPAACRAIAAALALGAPPLAGAAAAQPGGDLLIGIRADAAPFSYDERERTDPGPHPGTPREAGYRGYVADICSDVLDVLRRDRSGALALSVQVVNAQNRFRKLESGEIDILCDPATITGDRVDGFMLSMPIYLSAITFAAPKQFPQTEACRATVGVVSETTAEAHGIEQILDSGNWARFAAEIRAALSAIGNGQPPGLALVSSPGCPAEAVKLFGTHTELAEAFCSDQVLYYVGDIEIVRRKLQDNGRCFANSAIAPATFTDERYAIYGRAAPDPEKASLILAFYEELAQQVYAPESVLLTSYAANFATFRASDKLKAFYWSLIGTFPPD